MNKKIIFAILLLILIAFAFVLLTRKTPTSYIIQSENEVDIKDNNTGKVIDQEWIEDNCNCIERNKSACGFEGFEYRDDGFCHKGETFTNPMKKCSKYNCTGENYSYLEEEWKKD